MRLQSPYRKVKCVDGSTGYYISGNDEVGNLIIPNKYWPFPEHITLPRSAFKFASAKENYFEIEIEEAPF